MAAIIPPQSQLPPPTKAWFDPATGLPLKEFATFMKQLDGFSRQFGATGVPLTSPILVGPDTGRFPAFSVHKNGTNQTGVATGTFTQVTWSTELYDVGSYFASNLWTPPAGRIALKGAFYITGTIATGGLAQSAVFKNGSLFRKMSNANALVNNGMCWIAMEDVATGPDTYELRAYQDNITGTGTLNGQVTDTWFMGHWISPP